MRIDEKAVVPIGWVLSGLAMTVTATIVGACWVSTVNFRLERIEEKLGIPAYRSADAFNFDRDADAGQEEGPQ